MDLEKYLTNYTNTNLLRRFAFLGSTEQFNRKLDWLEKMAEPEKWRFKEKNEEDFNVLFYYVVHTFDRCFKQSKVFIDDNASHAAFNTGLMTPSGEEIYGTFTPSFSYSEGDPSRNYWYLNKFLKETDREFMDLGIMKPEMATYFTDYNELYFDPTLEISLNFDHIYEDNFERLPIEIRRLDKNIACSVFDGCLGHTKKRIRRNSRIPVPQFYHDKIMFLIPVTTISPEPVVLALEKMPQQYRANTILTMNMAYNCARLLTKPESNWLLPN